MSKRVYSSSYRDIVTLSGGNTGLDSWRFGLVTGNGENGVIENCGPATDVMIFQNIQFSYPTNAIRMTPDMSAVREAVSKCLIAYHGKALSAEGVAEANRLMLTEADRWIHTFGYGEKWDLQHTYSFHPAHQLRIQMEGCQNGEETEYRRFTDYDTAEIGAEWTFPDGSKWVRTTFASRADNVNITRFRSIGGQKLNLTISVDDISKMSNENDVNSNLADIRYRKFCGEDGSYIGWAAHYPFYRNSMLNNGICAGLTRIIAPGGRVEYVFGSETAENYQNPNGGADERILNIGYDKAPIVRVTGADTVYLITKTGRDIKHGTLGTFEAECAKDRTVRNGTAYPLVKKLIDETEQAARKYEENGKFNYDKALQSHEKIHAEIFNRLTYSVCTAPNDIAMREYTNEELIKAQQASPDRLLPAMLERLYNNGRYAAICSSGIQAPRLGGMWTGAWGCQWSGDYTTDANINLQIAGANIGALPEETVGFINIMLKNVPDWQMNAKMVYGIDDALLAPPRTDGDTAVLNHFFRWFPGQIWNAGASWLIHPMYEYYRCYGNQKIPLTPAIRRELEFTGDKFAGYTEVLDKFGNTGRDYDYNIRDKEGSRVVYNLRNTLSLTDKRAEEILREGYLDLERDVLYPLTAKAANFFLQFVDPRFYTKDGRAHYDENHTALSDGETYLFAPSYSPENQPANTGECFVCNAVMDIAAARSVVEMAISLEKKLQFDNADEKIRQYEFFNRYLPPYLYEKSGELKEWALWGYEENYGHRHGSQLYGLWPDYEAGRDKKLFDGAKTLIMTKNKVPSNDNVSGHGWLHRALVMARLKDSIGVRNTLLPMAATNMIYSSMMMSHNINMTAAYCTDPVITIPAVQLETLVYSDGDRIELLPALLPEIQSGGEINGTEGIRTRNGGQLLSLRWDDRQVIAVIAGSKGVSVSLNMPYRELTVNGVPAENNDSYTIDTDQPVEFIYAL